MSSRQETRDRVKQMREEQARKERRTERLVRLGVLAGVLVAVVAVVAAFLVSRSGTGEDAALPATVTEPAGGVVVGAADAPVKMEMWLDFQCPACKNFEDTNGDTVQAGIDDGTIQVTYKPMSFLGPESKLAANAFGCSADAGEPQQFLRTVYTNQGPENSGTFTEESLTEWGVALGFDEDTFGGCVNDEPYQGWVGNVAVAAGEAGVSSTPTIFLNGERQEDLSPEAFATAIEAAKA